MAGKFCFAKIWWTRTQRIRTAAALPIEMSLLEIVKPPVYQDIALKAGHLHQLGLSASRIAAALGVTDKTVAKALAWLKRDQ